MSLSLPPSPLWHHWSKQWLPWNTKMTAGNSPGASSRGVCVEVEGGRQPCSTTGWAVSECFPPDSSHHHPSNPLAHPGHAQGPLQPEPTAAAPTEAAQKRAESNAIKSCLSSDAFCAGEGRAGGTCHLWQSVIVTYKGSRCLSKGLGKPLKTRAAFKRRARHVHPVTRR